MATVESCEDLSELADRTCASAEVWRTHPWFSRMEVNAFDSFAASEELSL